MDHGQQGKGRKEPRDDEKLKTLKTSMFILLPPNKMPTVNDYQPNYVTKNISCISILVFILVIKLSVQSSHRIISSLIIYRTFDRYLILFNGDKRFYCT